MPDAFVVLGLVRGAIEMAVSPDHQTIRFRCQACQAELTRPIPTAKNRLEKIWLQHEDDCAFWNGIQTSLDLSRAAAGN